MRISVQEAKDKLAELLRRAESDEEVLLTSEGRPAARLVAIGLTSHRQGRRALLEAARRAGALKAHGGPSAARSQDFLYGEDGLPR